MSTTFGFSAATAMVAEGSIKRNANAIPLFIIFTLLLPYDLVAYLDGAICRPIIANTKRRPQVSAVTFGAKKPVKHGSGLNIDNPKLLNCLL
jgi:hypothetical protein